MVDAARTRSTLRSEVAKDDDRLVADLNPLVLDGLCDVVLAVKDHRLACELESLLARDLGDATAGGEVAAENAAVCSMFSA